MSTFYHRKVKTFTEWQFFKIKFHNLSKLSLKANICPKTDDFQKPILNKEIPTFVHKISTFVELYFFL